MDDIYNRVARRRHQGQRGFTLIELLVVIAILAVLAAIVIFNVTGVVQRGNTAACQTDLQTVQTASDAYYSDNGKYPTALGGAGAVVPNDLILPVGSNRPYLHSFPTSTGIVTIDANGNATAALCSG
ncbi:MAG TPA: prepilin-type N-terminal cleavage/methylation domain-containing protein [Candidatus Acidoferrum sp.]|nr:prepilin-type N-terminal cleavage/methylation domain-containing protein [Candidatus Acidoferrum sp.]